MARTGRPTGYSEDIVGEICTRLMAGEGLIGICRDNHLPCEKTVYNWLDDPEKRDFLQRYEHARAVQAHRMGDEILEIADDGTNDYMERENKDGSKHDAFNGEHVQRSRLRVDSRKWLMSKKLPKKYGERLALAGDDDTPLSITVKKYERPDSE